MQLAETPSRSKIGDGRPTMVFASVYREDNAQRRILFGCNTPDWRGLDAVSRVVKGFRDHRLQAYIPWGDSAFRALRGLETSFLSKTPGNDDNEPLWDARKKAKEAMESHHTFLGGTHESGMALKPPGWTHHMACYLCSSTMGHKDTKPWTESEQKRYFLGFD
jgi:hypothetical protein